MNFEELDKNIDQLKVMAALVHQVQSVKGHNMASRAIGDIERIVNSSWLNLYEYLDDNGIDPDKHFAQTKLTDTNTDHQNT